MQEAENLCLQRLGLDANDPNAHDLLGVLCRKQLRYREGLEHAVRAAEVTGWDIGQVRHHLAQTCARILSQRANSRQTELLRAHTAWAREPAPGPGGQNPRVSVVVSCRNQAGRIGPALESVFRQTYRAIELVVIDDGSTDETPAVIQKVLGHCPYPHRFLTTAPKGSASSLNEAIALSSGIYINPLDAEGLFTPDRIETMVEAVAGRALGWGFTRAGWVDAAGGDVSSRDPNAVEMNRLIASALGVSSTSMAFLRTNPAVAIGNLFFSRALYQRAGVFRDYRFRIDWDFALRAGRLEEPWLAAGRHYLARIREDSEAEETAEDIARARKETEAVLADFFASLDHQPCPNAFSPAHPGNRDYLLYRAMSEGLGAALPVPMLRQLALDLRTELATKEEGRQDDASPEKKRKRIALVVLGMHRSGTSALSRSLNLAGAVLPVNVRPPKLQHNERGFWEPEEVILLNEQLLATQGKTWMDRDAREPSDPKIRAQFSSVVANLLRQEYGDSELILLKDPRLCLFVDLWDEALKTAGYEPRYVIPLRSPLEVAASLNTRDALPAETGLALWLEYVHRAETLTRNRPRAFTSYEALLDDWRAELSCVAEVLGVPLDLQSRSDEIDAFLSQGLRRQRVDASALHLLPDLDAGREVLAQYELMLGLRAHDHLRSRRILVASVGLPPNGSIFRFVRTARLLNALGHEVCFVNLGGEVFGAFRDLRVLEFDEARSESWDAVVVPGAGFPPELYGLFGEFRASNFGQRIQAILNDTSRRQSFEALNAAFLPHALLINNRHWTTEDLTGFVYERLGTLSGAVDSKVFSPHEDRSARSDSVFRIGMQYKTYSQWAGLRASLPETTQIHVFGGEPAFRDGGNVHFHGPLVEEELAGFYRRMDLILAVERHAGWCNVAAEAMACGVPVVCSPAGTLDFAVDGVNARVLPADCDVETVAAAIRELIHAPEIRARFGSNGPAGVQHLNWEQWASDFLKLSTNSRC